MAETARRSGGSRSPARKPDLHPPTRRKSDRLSATQNEDCSAPVVKRSIVLKKIEPQRSVLAKSIIATPRRSPRISPNAAKENVGGDLASTPGDNATRVSPLLPGLASPDPSAETVDAERSTLMSQKVRRSYSRLGSHGAHADGSFTASPGSASEASDTSTPNQSSAVAAGSHRSFFGFDRLLASDAVPGISPVKRLTPKEKTAELPGCAGGSLVSLDVNIPGVAVAKERKKKRRVPQFEMSALDEWAAQMNASFEEAERFDLVVE
ncbi:sororin [Stegostoma tigrinum]|uniref:sororin n=1 Tax=Stegostoma tigrinum TaxID=3053191 RepID=UPI0028703FE6|nr:sororin [Stegostoma tigrinum]